MSDPVEQTIRHGFEVQYSSDVLPGEYQESDEDKNENVCYMYYTDKRHENNANVNPDHPAHGIIEHDWRMREKIKTVSCALVMCLNIGVDPPDVVKTNPCAKLEAWIDPFSLPTQKALEAIGKNIQTQYETLQPRARYKLSLDPCIEDVKKLCCSLRKSAKEERVLFHYNGHGVPKPTNSGEIWVFNKNYTQYIPLTLYDLQSWLGSPCMYVYDCSSAGNILLSFNRFAKQRDSEAAKLGHVPYTPMGDCIQLAACSPNDILPMSPDLPADLFTCCLTTPIQIALQWFAIQNPLLNNVNTEMILKIPGKLSDRRTPLGELNWIFTAITDTIAWSVLPHDLFKKYFRQDMMVAAMLRNFLLADRIMRSYNCTPMSMPPLPSTHQHPLWRSWDFAVDMCLAQLPALLAMEEGGPPVEYKASTLFNEQLTAFEIWLTHGSINRNPPEQLPILLQVLLSQGHRLRALILLCKFLDLGPWAVDLALAVGIFPYVLKLLQSPAADLKPLLVFIWARILAVDSSCQSDLLKDDGYNYFVNVLAIDSDISPIPNISEHRAMCTFILSVLCDDFRPGREACLRSNVLSLCLSHLADEDPLLRQWACLCIGQQWTGFADAKCLGIRENAHEKLCTLLSDPVPEVRSAAMYALGLFIGDLDKTEQVINIEHNIAISMLIGTSDGSPMVRRELVVALSSVVHEYVSKFLQIAYELVEEDRKQTSQTVDERMLQRGRTERRNLPEKMFRSINHSSVYTCVWKALLNLSADPHNDVSTYAIKVVDYVHYQLINSSMSEAAASSLLHLPPPNSGTSRNGSINSGSEYSLNGSQSNGNQRLTSKITSTLRRSASFSLKALGYVTGVTEEPDTNSNTTDASHNHPTKRTSFMSRNDSFTSTSELNAEVENSIHTKGSDPYEKITLPLQSYFYNWCREYFAEPQMRPAEADEPGSGDYNERLWGRMRN
ncbi:Target of rapamycin complex 1 subunit kog1 [Basidiobolus ranarum]|uniref:Target of rapamycin complex 1 subunit kog1 n=1 Tax=Basidiobolus ranarum TaxID=34480 RepID=A0ABR2VS83_9FUNG